MRWRAVVALSAVLCAGVSSVTGVDEVSASGEADDSEGIEGVIGSGGGRAPEWPFRGIVDYIAYNDRGWYETDGTLEWYSAGDPMELGYWDADTGEITRVALGPTAYCFESPHVTNTDIRLHSSDAVDYGNGVMSDQVTYGIPWGEEAYPLVRKQQYGRNDPDPAAGPLPHANFRTLLPDKLRVSHRVEGVGLFVGLATLEREAYYVYDRYDRTVAQDDPLPGDHEFGGYGLHGTDGYYYAIDDYPLHPLCSRAGFMVAGGTGEVVACWMRDHGPSPVFVLPVGSPVLDRFALPVVPDGGDCPQWSLSALKPQQLPNGGGGG